MAYDYEKLYAEQPNALGAANVDVIAFFQRLSALRILDVGCGQGRDALALAQMGHHVHGIDLSASGVAQMCEAAHTEGLGVTGEVADITLYHAQNDYDAMVIDRTLHMLPNGTREAVLDGLLRHMPDLKHVIILDEAANLLQLRAVFDRFDGWQITALGGTGKEDIYRQGFTAQRA